MVPERCLSDGVCGAFTQKSSLTVTEKDKTEPRTCQEKPDRFIEDSVGCC